MAEEKNTPFIKVVSSQSKLVQGAVFHSVGKTSGKPYESVVLQISRPVGNGKFTRQKFYLFPRQVPYLQNVLSQLEADPSFASLK
jgi:hypothetical protein